jgi:hypothetical protein
MNCPNCNSQLAPGATVCARCGHQLVTPAPADPAGLPASTDPLAKEAAAAATAINIDFTAIRSRLGLQQSTTLTAAAVLALAAVIISTYAHIRYLTTKSVDTQLDSQVIFSLALGCAIAAAALAVLLRWQAGPLPRAEADSPDLKFAALLGVITGAFVFVGFILGQGARLEASDSWFRYALVFAFLTTAWLTISRPVPARFATGNGATPVLAALGVALLLLVVGTVIGQSDKFDTWVKGLSWQQLGTVPIVLLLGFFLGLEDRRGVVTGG